MKRLPTVFVILSGTGLTLLILIVALLPGQVDFQKEMLGQPASESLTVFCAAEELEGDFTIALTDCRINECNEKLTPIYNRLRQETLSGKRGRTLHVCSLGMPVNRYIKSEKRGHATIIANPDVVYADRLLRRIPKPALLRLRDGNYVSVEFGDDFDRWLEN